MIGEPLKAQAFEGVMGGLVARAQSGEFLAAARANTFQAGGEGGNGSVLGHGNIL